MGRILTFTVLGNITADDQRDLGATFIKLAALIADSRLLVLDSNGGDLDAAMAMGRFFREQEFDALVRYDGVCQSACVFLLASGIDKAVDGDVGIHRPYYTSGDPARAAEGIRATKDEVAAFLDEMNIRARLAADMFSVSPSDMRILSTSELRDYRLNSSDYVAEEDKVLRDAERWGCPEKPPQPLGEA